MVEEITPAVKVLTQEEERLLDLQGNPLWHIPDEEITDPQAYLKAAAAVMNAAGDGRIKPVDAPRYMKLITDNCLALAHIELSEVAKQHTDIITRLTSILETDEPDLLKLIEAIEHIDDERVSMGLKKKWIGLIHQTIELQAECRTDPAKTWTYVGRDSETAAVFQMAPCHLNYFEVWNDPTKANSLVMAPPGHGKTTCLRGQIIWEVGNQPNLRCLIIYDQKDKVRKEVNLIKKHLRSPWFRALYPDVRVLDQKESGENSGLRFTVARKNWMSREPSIEGAAIGSLINGNGYSRIYGDDYCDPDVKNHPKVRNSINERWTSVVEERLRGDWPRIRIICTPWHEEDSNGLIRKGVERGQLTNWRLGIDQFEIKDDPDTHVAIPIWRCNKFTPEFFEEKKVRLGDRYTLNYRLSARERDQKIVKRLQFYHSILAHPLTGVIKPDNKRGAFFDDEGLIRALDSPAAERWLSIDPSASAGVQSSDVGVLEGIITPKGYAYIPQVWSLQLGPVAMQDWIVDFIIKSINLGHPLSYVLIEAQGAMKGQVSLWIHRIGEILDERKILPKPTFIETGTRIKGRGQNVGKAMRLAEIASYLEHGLVRFAGERQVNRYAGYNDSNKYYIVAVKDSTMDMLRRNTVDFNPAGRTDMVDALTQFILHNQSRIVNPNVSIAQVVEESEPTDQFTRMLRKQTAKMGHAEAQSEYTSEDRFMQSKFGLRSA